MLNINNRKFYKIDGLNTIFPLKSGVEGVYNTETLLDDESLKNNGIDHINTDTILFITASSNDEGKTVYTKYFERINEVDEPVFYSTPHILTKGDTMVWVKNDLYSISSKHIRSIETVKEGYLIKYSDSTENILPYVGKEAELHGIFPIVVDNTNNKIHLWKNNPEQQIESYNLVLNLYSGTDNTNNNDTNTYGCKQVAVIGRGNIATENEQIIVGKFNEPENDKKFIIGNGESVNNRKNIFSVSESGTVTSTEDFVIKSKDSDVSVYHLSYIHSVMDEDWICEGEDYTSFSGDFSNDYSITLPDDETGPFFPWTPDGETDPIYPWRPEDEHPEKPGPTSH